MCVCVWGMGQHQQINYVSIWILRCQLEDDEAMSAAYSALHNMGVRFS